MAGDGSGTHVGALFYQSGVNTTTLLEPNKTSTKKFLRETGDGTNGTAPVWEVVSMTDIGGTLPILNGGTNATSFTSGALTYYNGTSLVSSIVSQSGTTAWTADNSYAKQIGVNTAAGDDHLVYLSSSNRTATGPIRLQVPDTTVSNTYDLVLMPPTGGFVAYQAYVGGHGNNYIPRSVDSAAHTIEASGVDVDDTNNLNIPSGSVYQINDVNVLTATGLGSAVVSSSLTSVGTLTALQVDDVNINGHTISTTTANDLILTANSGNAVTIEGVAFDANGTSVITQTVNADLTIAAYSGKNVSVEGVTFDNSIITSGTWNGTDIAVADGGTGVSSIAGWSVVCGGANADGTHALQTVSGVGSAGQALTSNGAAALPTWQKGISLPTATARQFQGAVSSDRDLGSFYDTWECTVPGASYMDIPASGYITLLSIDNDIYEQAIPYGPPLHGAPPDVVGDVVTFHTSSTSATYDYHVIDGAKIFYSTAGKAMATYTSVTSSSALKIFTGCVCVVGSASPSATAVGVLPHGIGTINKLHSVQACVVVDKVGNTSTATPVVTVDNTNVTVTLNQSSNHIDRTMVSVTLIYE